MVDRIEKRNKTVKIALVGKYTKLHDAYLSVMEALQHAGYVLGSKVEINWVNQNVSVKRPSISCFQVVLVSSFPGALGTVELKV